MLGDAGVAVSDGEAWEVHGIGFAGTKGFAGGFGTHALGPWGEPIIKQFVHEAIQEALKLETALARIRTSTRIVLLHYTPVRSTADGEPPEIVPYLASSRLEEPINRYAVTAVFHGHAHHGQLEGETSRGVKVYNVSSSLLRSRSPDRPFRILEVDRQPGGTAHVGVAVQAGPSLLGEPLDGAGSTSPGRGCATSAAYRTSAAIQ